MHVSCGWARAGAGHLALVRRRTWTTSPVPELAAVVRERAHQRPALDMVAPVRLPNPAIAGVGDIALGLPVAGCSLRLIGRAHVCNPVTNAHLDCPLLTSKN